MQEVDVRMSELVRRSGIPLATVKYYLRMGLLMPGTPVSRTSAAYGEEHVRRLALVRALTEVAGLPVQKAGEVLRLIDEPESDLFETIGRAVAALPPYVEERKDYPLARAALARMGQLYDPRYVAVAQLERSLQAASDAGMPLSNERLDVYARHIMAIAETDIALVPRESTASAVEYSVLGTALYEPVLAAMRRLAHQDIASRRLAGPRP